MAEEEKKEVKRVRFPLHLADGTGARTLEELREHGDVESVLKHYREGTLARWLKAFRYDELAERVAEHRNAQLEGSKANLREVFGILEIPLEEEVFAEYCENKLSKGFVFSDAEGGDLKPYGQGVSIKDKLVEFLPEGKLPGGDSLEDWEVTETELDEGNLLVEFTCEKRNILVSLQFACEDECYKKVTNQLGRLVNAFNPAVPGYDTENTQESPKKQDVQEPRYYRIGDTGPGGGIVFYNDGKMAYEVSYVLGCLKWGEAKKVADGYRGGGFSDWRLPTKEELNLVYQNLRKPGIITGNDWHWSSSQSSNYDHWAQSFGGGGQVYNYGFYEYSVRAIRSFSIDEQPQDRQENVEFGKINSQQELRNYRIGERGPGGGLVFHIEGSRGYEVSEVLGTHKWAEAEKVAEGYYSGGFSGWRLPTKEELDLVYQNLRKLGIIKDGNWYWSSSKGGRFNSEMWLQEFSSGRQSTFSYSNTLASVRAIRSFSIDEQPQDRQENVEFGKINNQQKLRNYRIGERGPGGGLVFHIEGPRVYEVSEVLGKHQWAEAEKVAEGYRGGNLSDWRLPTKEELKLVYQNLWKPGIITETWYEATWYDWYWSSSGYCNNHYWAQRIRDGYQSTSNGHSECAVRAIRSFSIDE